MSLGPPLAGGADLLTRTTLRIDGSSASSVTALVNALHRVPGVLFAEVDPSSTRAIVAHDAAVPRAALLAAATAAGVRVEAPASTPTAAIGVGIAAPAARSFRVRNFTAAAIGSYVALAFIAVLRPNGSESPWLFSVILLPIWAFVIAQAIGRRRR